MKKEARTIPNTYLKNTYLKTQRLKKNWSQVYVATMIGTNNITVSRWENGTTVPSLYYQQQLCELFAKSAEELGLLPAAEETSQDEGSEESGLHASSELWNVPARRNPFFTGREESLVKLPMLLRTGTMTALTQAQAISGLGGIGKTQTAIEYAYRYRDDYGAVLWVKADTPQILASDFAALAGLLHLPEQDEQDQSHAIEAVMRWLKTHTNWLLILDNVEDIAMTSDLLAIGTGHLLLTTRAQVTGSFAHCLSLEQMDLGEGALFLLRRAKLIEPDAQLEGICGTLRAEAMRVCQLVGGLPLALDQAGAYIEETGCSLSDYLERYQTRQTCLLARRGNLVTGHPESVSTTFSLSFERVEQADPAAADLLRLCAFLDPDAIPEEILSEGASDLSPILQPVAADPIALDEALATLRNYSLLRRNPETATFTIHRLVQAVLKERMEQETRCLWAERTVRAVHRAFPAGTFEMWPRCQRHLSHALLCAGLIEQEDMLFLEAAQLLTRLGNYLVDRGRYKEVDQFLQRALTTWEPIDCQHIWAANSLDGLARLYTLQGKCTEAEILFRRSLSVRERWQGREHPDTLATMEDYADLLVKMHRGEEAAQTPYSTTDAFAHYETRVACTVV